MIEYEATFLDINKDEMRGKLKELGAELVYEEYKMKRWTFDPPVELPKGFVRVRQEADKKTMTIKTMEGDGIECRKEWEVQIDDIEKGIDFLQTLGCTKKAYQESLRELWKLGSTEIMIDTWPGLHPYVEVEGPDESATKSTAEKLGFDWGEAVFGESTVYAMEKELGIPRRVFVYEMPEVTFDNPPQKYEE